MKSRILIVFAGLMFLWGVLGFRAAYLQFFPNDRLDARQSRLFQTVVNLQARRGAITDRDGRELAMSSVVYSLYADPKIIENKKKVAKDLAKILKESPDHIMAKIRDRNRRFVWIQRMLDKDKADQVKELGVRGLSFVEEYKRIYPNENLLSQTIGFIGSEGQGLEGVERIFDQRLKGNNKKISVRRDARGRPLLADGLVFAENPDGDDIRLTIDSELQFSLESELKNAIETFEAESAVGVVLDVKTSEVLALVSAPSFDVNRAASTPAAIRRNRVVTDAFEPGSTLKSMVIAAGLREGILKPETKFFCENGSYRIGKRVIKEAETHEKFGYLSATEILAVSSNIGTTKIGFELGDDRLRQAMVDFGFGAKTEIDLPGEARGIVQELPWHQHLLANVSFGHGISATPIQVANAYAAIANGGVLNAPYIVSAIRNGETGELKENKPRPIRRVLSDEQARQMREMLVATTEIGTGKNAKVAGYVVGGKTGTAQKVNPNGRGYLPGAYISSFAGFIPANDPKYVIYVAVDSAKKSFYGGAVAAPIFSRIASYAVRKKGVAPQILSEVKKSLPSKKIESIAVFKADSAPLMVVPELKGLTAREVLRRFIGQDVKLKIRGQGVVSDVYPAAGSQLPAEVEVILK